MKKYFIMVLFSFIILVFTGCSHKPSTLQDIREVYGDDYEVINIDNINFLIVWDSGEKMIFRNNEYIARLK